jgi:very-short-patch-repair endonuclease
MREVRAVAALQPGRAGPAAVVRLLAHHDVDATTRSALEDELLELCRRYGIARPALNSRVRGFEVDFAWPAQRLVVETDGHRHHGTRAAFERDRARDAELVGAGWRVVRLTHRRVHGAPSEVADLLARLLGRYGD